MGHLLLATALFVCISSSAGAWQPATGNRFAAADPRRDCYAIAY